MDTGDWRFFTTMEIYRYVGHLSYYSLHELQKDLYEIMNMYKLYDSVRNVADYVTQNTQSGAVALADAYMKYTFEDGRTLAGLSSYSTPTFRKYFNMIDEELAKTNRASIEPTKGVDKVVEEKPDVVNMADDRISLSPRGAAN